MSKNLTQPTDPAFKAELDNAGRVHLIRKDAPNAPHTILTVEDWEAGKAEPEAKKTVTIKDLEEKLERFKAFSIIQKCKKCKGEGNEEGYGCNRCEGFGLLCRACGSPANRCNCGVCDAAFFQDAILAENRRLQPPPKKKGW